MAAKAFQAALFLSTLSLRRATADGLTKSQQITNFYPRSPCGERHRNILRKYRIKKFLSTLSLRRATQLHADFYVRSDISIHALLAESDIREEPDRSEAGNFYPRSPCGERHDSGLQPSTNPNISIHALLAESDVRPACGVGPSGRFLSTLSLRRATRSLSCVYLSCRISIHALLAESDYGGEYEFDRYTVFLSTLSLRRATGSD